ncbi:JNK1/MAPK8-associated membrane protein [Ditylenchus destructor]|nr:JNK1/MAPK8-associated membrane protein [Ditylenchus destructor]
MDLQFMPKTDQSLYAIAIDGLTDTFDECPGFCGRIPQVNESNGARFLSACQACPWGARSGKQSLCYDCSSSLNAYDYCFFIFHTLVTLFINSLFVVKFYSRRKPTSRHRLWLTAQICCVMLESSLSLITALLISNPSGSLSVYGCPTQSIYEWYPMFFNPLVNYTKVLRCSHELVYPRYTLPFINLCIQLVNLLVLRSVMYIFAATKTGTKLPAGPFYAALWVLPMTAFFHSILSGVVYFIFPYICVISSLALNAIHMAMQDMEKGKKELKGIKEMFKIVFSKNGEHLALVTVHMLLFGFGIVSIALFEPGSVDWTIAPLLLVVLPVPTLFYILTIRLTVPAIRAVRYRHR